MTSNLIPRPNTELSSETFTKKASLIARGLNEISLLKPSPESLYQTGMDYYEGSNGKPWDILKAYAYLVKSAEQGFVLAQWRLACMFDGDEAVEENEKKEYWHEKAALNGHLMAMYELLSDSSETYVQELTHLAESGCYKASDQLCNYYHTGDYEHIEKDMKQAWYWFKRGIEQGSSSITFNLAKNATAEFWNEVDKDIDTGAYWITGESLLCKERYSATEREQYYENRMIWLIEKAQQGEAFAQLALSSELNDINENWQLVICEKLFRQQAAIAADEPIDWEKLSMFWLTKSAEQGLWYAQLLYGLSYLNDHVNDYEKALYWLRRAMEQDLELGEYYSGAIVAFNSDYDADYFYCYNSDFRFEDLKYLCLNKQDSI